ncbi:hypothetical protein MMC27_002755 [Xylographa pallens]|nr:hypothetical protein [Xylographa pallens]
MYIDQSKERSTRPLTRTPSPGGSATPLLENDRMEGPQFDRVQTTQNDHGFSQETSATQQMNVANPRDDLLIQYGINPNYLTPAQLESYQARGPQFQEKELRVYAQNMLAQQRQQSILRPIKPCQDSAACRMPSRLDGGMSDMYIRSTGMRMHPAPQLNNAHNHALQDYEMQLMLLDQQNKQRLLMARMAQDSHCSVGTDGSVMPDQSVIKSKI